MANGLLDRFQPQTIGYGNTLLEDPAQYDLSGFKAISNVMGDYARAAIDSGMMPGRAIKGELGQPSLLNPQFTEGATQFGIDFGMLPALGTAAVAAPSTSTLRMGSGGVDTASGGARRGPQVDELGFYNQAFEVAKNLQQSKGTGQQFRKMMEKAGVKPDEIKFTPGLEGLLSQPKVTREEIVSLLGENRIVPDETVFYAGDSEFEKMAFPREPEQLDIYEAYGSQYVDDEVDYFKTDMPEDVAEAFGRFTDRATEEDVAKVKQALEENDITQLVYKGSDLYIDDERIDDVLQAVDDAAERLVVERYNYEPVLRLRDPDTDYEIIGNDDYGYTIKNEDGDTLRGEYYSLNEARIQAEADAMERGVIGYGGGETRFMEYTEDGGKNYREMLLQVHDYEGKREDFYESGHFDEPNVVVHARTKDRTMAKDAGGVLYVEEMQSDWGQQGRRQGFSTEESIKAEREIRGKMNSERDSLQKLNKEKRDIIEMLADDIADGTYTGPNYRLDVDPENFKYTTMNGSIYRVLPDGASELVLSASGIERDYILGSKYLDDYNEIATEMTETGQKFDLLRDELSVLDTGPQQGPFVGNSEKFAEIGIKRLINQAAQEDKKYLSFSSGDVQYDRWNEEGLIDFYDKILPKVAKKVAKRLDPDAEVGPMNVRMDERNFGYKEPRFSIEITPKMRERALQGQPLFTAPAVPAPVSGLLNEEKMTGDEMLRAGII